ncbi:JmjC domain-containing protein [Bacillus cereus]|uniref:JmjC domain-containing protein n=1 Tax=Bacillus cereus TaxID=1396 RepID=A0A9X6YTE7_BACCE|nr:cupin domain-containing protein [Bacillus cereus]PEQ87810.1 hypothetical protein CN475_11940 [Bacillus cereus]
MESTKRLLDFLENISHEEWNEKPVLHSIDNGWTEEIFSPEAIKYLFTEARIPEPCFRVIKKGNFEPHRPYSRPIIVGEVVASHILDGTKATLALNEGDSIIISAVEEFWKPIRLLCNELTKKLGTKCSAFTVITPPGESGFLPHIDRTEQLVIQCQGKKYWKVFDVHKRGKKGLEVDINKIGDPILELELTKGDVLYLPQGAPHVAYTTDTLSYHITLTFEPITIGTWIKSALEELLEKDEEFVKALNPFWFKNQELHLKHTKEKSEEISKDLTAKAIEIALNKLNSYHKDKLQNNL